MTHTRISVSGHGNAKWTFALRNCLKSRHESAGKHQIARFFALTAPHNPEVVGSNLASATIKSTGWWLWLNPVFFDPCQKCIVVHTAVGNRKTYVHDLFVSAIYADAVDL